MEGGGCTIDAGRREGGGVREAEAHLATTTVSEGCRSLHSMNAVLLILIVLTTSTRAMVAFTASRGHLPAPTTPSHRPILFSKKAINYTWG